MDNRVKTNRVSFTVEFDFPVRWNDSDRANRVEEIRSLLVGREHVGYIHTEINV